MLHVVVRYFYPDLKKKEIKKFTILALAFFLTIGSYWLLRLLKKTIFYKVCFPESLGWLPCQGRLFDPIAKFYSPFVVVGLVLVYSWLVDRYKKQALFYIIYGFYATLFAGFALILFLRQAYGDAFLGKSILGGLGWLSYFSIESFGSLAAALFWSFTNSITTSDTAKRGAYAFIIACAQLGAIFGSSAVLMSHLFGIWQLFALVAVLTASVTLVIRYFMQVIPPSQREEVTYQKQQDVSSLEQNTGALATIITALKGVLAGPWLLITRPYLLGVLIVSTIYEAINYILEYQMLSQVDLFPRFGGEFGFAQFAGFYGVATNVLSFLMALLGTSYLIKNRGLRFGILFYPVALVITLAGLYLFIMYGAPSAGYALLATFLAMITVKGLGYAVNNPVKEMMYIPTSKDAKYKTKGFIDMVGGRGAKQLGATVSGMLKNNMTELFIYGTFFSFGLSAIWIVAALFVARKNKQLLAEGKIIQ